MLAVCLSAVALPAFAQASPDADTIRIALDQAHAPVTTANFLKYVESGRFNGEGFYRALKYGGGGLIQGGITSDARKLYPAIAHEPTNVTGLKNKAWTVAMANSGPGTARSDFFIMTTDVPAFDAKADDVGFAAFGKVIEGQEVVKAILSAPVSPTKGEGSMKGQMLEPMVKIVKAERLGD